MKKQTLLLLALICSALQTEGMSIRRHITETIEQAIVKEVEEEVKNNQTQTEIAPAHTIEASQAVKERQKQVQSLAKFIASKQSIRTLANALHRSIKPTEKLLHRCLTVCDFHRHQLRDIQQALQEFIALLRKHEPALIESIFSLLSDQRFATFMESLGKLDVTQDQLKIQHSQLDKESSVTVEFKIQHEQLRSLQHEQLRSLLEEFSAKLEGMEQDFQVWVQKWSPAFEKIAPYIIARSKDHQEYLQTAMNTFGKSMIWQHIGPTLGLAIKSWWHMRGVKNITQSGPQLISATYAHAMQNQETLKQETHAAFGKILKAYEDMFRRTFSYAYSRSPQ